VDLRTLCRSIPPLGGGTTHELTDGYCTVRGLCYMRLSNLHACIRVYGKGSPDHCIEIEFMEGILLFPGYSMDPYSLAIVPHGRYRAMLGIAASIARDTKTHEDFHRGITAHSLIGVLGRVLSFWKINVVHIQHAIPPQRQFNSKISVFQAYRP
jgi:hypothetical protein